VPERSEDEVRPVTGAMHAGSSRRDDVTNVKVGAAGGLPGSFTTARSAGGGSSND